MAHIKCPNDLELLAGNTFLSSSSLKKKKKRNEKKKGKKTKEHWATVGAKSTKDKLLFETPAEAKFPNKEIVV